MMAQSIHLGIVWNEPPPHSLVSGIIIKKYGRVRQWKELMSDMRGSCVVSGLNYLTPLCLG